MIARKAPVASALFRLLEVSAGFDSVGILAAAAGALEVVACSSAFGRSGLAPGKQIDSKGLVASDGARNEAFRIAPGRYGLEAAFAAAAPITGGAASRSAGSWSPTGGRAG